MVQYFVPQIQQDYPKIKDAGSFPLRSRSYGPKFEQLIKELKSEAFLILTGRKIYMDLINKPVMITVRGKADQHDGQIHKDSKTPNSLPFCYI